jgi:hypothetical protein
MALTSFDIQQARVKLVLFKSRLRSVLYGVREAEPSLFSPADNPVGQWVRTSLRPELGHRPEVRELEQALQHMLSTGESLATRYQRGPLQSGRAGLDQVNVFADQIEALLQALDRGYATAA